MLRFVYFLNHHQQDRRMGHIKFHYNFEKMAICIYHSFNVFFSITTYNFLTTDSELHS